MLYAFGSKSDKVQYNTLYGSAQSVPMKAIVKNTDFLNDKYIQQKIYKNIYNFNYGFFYKYMLE